MAGARRYLQFQVGDALCAVALACAREVLPMAELMKPPLMPSLVEGVLNLGSSAIPVLRLDRILGLPEASPTPQSHLLLVEDHSFLFILLVDRALGVVTPEAESVIEAREHQSLNRCVAAHMSGGDGASTQILALDRLLLEQERRAVGEFLAMSQKRLLALMPEAA